MARPERALHQHLKLRHLQLLVALDEFRHLGRAAASLSLTQPAVSKSLAEIERAFGLSLFARSSRGTEPTAYGAALVRFARSVLSDFHRTSDEIAGIASGAGGRIRIGAMVVAIPGLLSRAVELLKAQSAQTTVLVEEGDLTRLLPRLRVGELDLFVGRLEPGYAAPDLQTEPLYDEPMCIIARPGHKLAHGKPSWPALAAEPWVVTPPWASSRPKLDQLFYRRKLAPPVNVIETASFLVTMTFVRRHSALGFVARAVARQMERDGLAKIVNAKVAMELPPVGILTLRERIRSASSEQMIACFRKAAEEYR